MDECRRYVVGVPELPADGGQAPTVRLLSVQWTDDQLAAYQAAIGELLTDGVPVGATALPVATVWPPKRAGKPDQSVATVKAWLAATGQDVPDRKYLTAEERERYARAHGLT